MVNIASISSKVNLNPPIDTRNAAIVGLCMSVLILLGSSWRLLYHYSGLLSKCCNQPREDEQLSRLRIEGLTRKRLSHVLLWMAMLLELVAYADMLVSKIITKLNYTLLDIIGRGILEYTTFSLLTAYWFKLTSRARAGASENIVAFTLFPVILAIVTISMIIINALEAYVLLSSDYPSVHDFRAQSTVHRIVLIVEASAWGIHAIIVSICGGMVYRRVSSLPNFLRVRNLARRRIIIKVIIPIDLCALSFGLRSGWYAADFISLVKNPSSTFETGAGWWVGNAWLSTLIPSLCILYVIRKRDRAPGSIDGVSEALLQSRSTNGRDDPIQSFKSTFRDLDDESYVGLIDESIVCGVSED